MEKGTEARKMALKALQEKLPESLFAEPIEYIFADHFRQRILCSVLDEIANAKTANLEMIGAVLNFMNSDFGPHVFDEEEGLFPLLRKRAEPEDDINKVLDQLSEEHLADEADSIEIIKSLEELFKKDGNAVLDDHTSKLFKRFAANERQHLIVENAIVLPLARVRLTQRDQYQLGKKMAARRGVTFRD